MLLSNGSDAVDVLQWALVKLLLGGAVYGTFGRWFKLEFVQFFIVNFVQSKGGTCYSWRSRHC